MQLPHRLGPDEYDVFISYSRADASFAATLYRKLSAYRPPGKLNAPRRRLRVFRDVSDIYGSDLDDAIRRHIDGSARLVVLCSPASRASGYVDAEIRQFAQRHGADAIVPVLVDGVPNDEVAADDERRAFSTALIAAMGGTPLAVDYRSFGGGSLRRGRFRAAWYQLLAGIFALSPRLLEQRDRARLRRRVTAGASVALLVAASLLGLGVRASRLAREAKSRELAQRVLTLPDEQRDLALLLSAEAVRQAPTFEARSALLEQLERSRRVLAYLWQPDTLYRIALDPQGQRVAAGTRHGRIAIWQLQSPRAPMTANTGAASPVRSLAFSADGDLLVAGAADGLLRVFSAASGAALGEGLHVRGVARGVALSSDDATLAVLAGDSAHLLDRASSRRVARSRTADAVGFTEDGVTVVWTGERLETWDGEPFAPASGTRIRWTSSRLLALSEDGRRVARPAPASRGVDVIDTRDGIPRREPVAADGSAVLDVAWSRGGENLITSTAASGVQVWSGRLLEEIDATFTGHRSYPRALAAATGVVAAGAVDGAVIVWRLNGSVAAGTRLERDRAQLMSVTFSSDGALLAAGADDGRALVWDAATLRRADPGPSLRGRILDLAFLEAGELVAVAATGEILRWRAGQADTATVAIGSIAGVTAAITRDGARLATAAPDSGVLVWDLTPAVAGPATLRHSSRARSLVFSADGGLLAATDGGRSIQLWDLTRSPAERTVLEGHTAPVASVAFGARDQLYSADAADRIHVWDAGGAAQSPRHAMQGPADYLPRDALAASPNGRLLAHGHADGAVVLWDLPTRQRLGPPLRPDRFSVTHLAFSPDSRRIAAASLDGSVIVWELDTAAWIARACERANRTLTEDERLRYLGAPRTAAACDR